MDPSALNPPHIISPFVFLTSMIYSLAEGYSSQLKVGVVESAFTAYIESGGFVGEFIITASVTLKFNSTVSPYTNETLRTPGFLKIQSGSITYPSFLKDAQARNIPGGTLVIS